MLATRQLYKRVAVVSSLEARLWKDLQRFCALGGSAVLSLSRNLQRRLSKLADAALDDAKVRDARLYVTGHDPSVIDEAAETLRLNGAVLVDIPLARDDEGEALRYYPEAVHRHQRDEFKEFPKLADSKLWELVGEQMHSLAGRVRVFCDPAVVVLSRTRVEGKDEPILGQSNVESELHAAVSETLGEQ